jgi:hypothetical protein
LRFTDARFFDLTAALGFGLGTGFAFALDRLSDARAERLRLGVRTRGPPPVIDLNLAGANGIGDMSLPRFGAPELMLSSSESKLLVFLSDFITQEYFFCKHGPHRTRRRGNPRAEKQAA